MSGTVNTDFYAKPQVVQPLPPPNLLQTLEGAARIKNMQAEQQNMLLEQQARQRALNGQAALGKYAAQSTDPQTGQTDWNKAMASMAADTDPDTRAYFPQAVKQGLDAGLVQADMLGKNLQTGLTRYGAYSQVAGSLISQYAKSGTPITKQDVSDAITQMDASLPPGVKDPQGEQQFIASLPDDPNKIMPMLYRYMGYAAGAREQMASVLGQFSTIHTPQGEFTVAQKPAFGTSTPAGGLPYIPAKPSPDAAGAPTDVVDDNGAKRTVPAAAARQLPEYGPDGQLHPAPGTGTVGGSSGAPAELSPGAKTTLGPYAEDLNNRAQMALQIQQRLRTMQSTLKDFRTGPGTDTLQAVANAIDPFNHDLANKLVQGSYSKADAQAAMDYYTKSQLLLAYNPSFIDASIKAGTPVSEGLFNTIHEQLLSKTMQTPAIQAALSYYQKIAGQTLMEQQQFNDFMHPKKDKNGNVPHRDAAQWRPTWTQILSHTKSFNTDQERQFFEQPSGGQSPPPSVVPTTESGSQ